MLSLFGQTCYREAVISWKERQVLFIYRRLLAGEE